MPQQPPKPSEDKPIAQRVSALAALLKFGEANDREYNLESSYVEHLKKSLSSGKEVSLLELAQRLSYERDRHDLTAEIEKHTFRKKFLWCLFGLTCVWLFLVIIFVGWNASSPSVEDRTKLLLLQSQIASNNNTSNFICVAEMKTATPHFCSTLFHLSDSVLIAFITSTTVAVLGLFLTAANWLYGKHPHKKISHSAASKNQSEEVD